MKRILKSPSGNIAIAALLAVIGLMSGVSIAGIAVHDARSYQWEHETLQSLHFLRAEANRGQAILEYKGDISGIFYTPKRSVAVESSTLKRSYSMQSKVYKEMAETTENVIVQGGAAQTGSVGEQREHYKVQSLVESKRGVGQAAYYGANDSMIRKYGELTIVQTNFSEFMYFTDQDVSPAGNNVYFYGYDVITGKVHSNSDIQIKQAGGGNNNGWPTFLNLVTTAGHIVSTPSNYPLNQVFQGGLVEEYDGYDFPELANTLRRKGRQLGEGVDHIYFLTIDGNAFSGMHGYLGTPRRVSKIVYDEYPPPGDSLYTNVFTVRDTLWTPYPGGISAAQGFMVNGDLWIRGKFSGYQTWGCTGEMLLMGDISLTRTDIPLNPKDNPTDVVGLVSEHSITINYGYRDPQDSLRYHPNVGSDNDYPDPAGGGIFLYAAMCALGDGGSNMFKHGVFTFEYQHPHPSTPAVLASVEYPDGTVEQVLFDWIDIHRRKYPPTGQMPWPTPQLGQQRLDLPWYNPLWPEARPYLERGTINIWGAVAQRVRGFVHRSHNDGEYPSNSGVWDIEIDKCGYPTDPQQIQDPVFGGQLGLVGMNYPGAAGSGVGYKKNYNYDNRLLTISPLFYPEVRLKGGKNPMTQGNWNIKRPPRILS